MTVHPILGGLVGQKLNRWERRTSLGELGSPERTVAAAMPSPYWAICPSRMREDIVFAEPKYLGGYGPGKDRLLNFLGCCGFGGGSRPRIGSKRDFRGSPQGVT